MSLVIVAVYVILLLPNGDDIVISRKKWSIMTWLHVGLLVENLQELPLTGEACICYLLGGEKAARSCGIPPILSCSLGGGLAEVSQAIVLSSPSINGVASNDIFTGAGLARKFKS